MSSSVMAALLAWLLALITFLGFIVLLRYIDHRERMAMISRGIDPNLSRNRRGVGVLRAGLITLMVGLALTVGLYPIGFIPPLSHNAFPFKVGPWLLPGLIPLGVGCALIVSYYLTPPSDQPPEEPQARE